MGVHDLEKATAPGDLTGLRRTQDIAVPNGRKHVLFSRTWNSDPHRQHARTHLSTLSRTETGGFFYIHTMELKHKSIIESI